MLQAHNAAEASSMAFQTANTMEPGDVWHSTLVQLGLAHASTADKETVFRKNVEALGFTLATRVEMKVIDFPDGRRQHPVLPMKGLAMEILKDYPKLLFVWP